MQAWRCLRPLDSAIVNNALFHSDSHIKQMLPQIILFLCFFYSRFVASGQSMFAEVMGMGIWYSARYP